MVQEHAFRASGAPSPFEGLSREDFSESLRVSTDALLQAPSADAISRVWERFASNHEALRSIVSIADRFNREVPAPRNYQSGDSWVHNAFYTWLQNRSPGCVIALLPELEKLSVRDLIQMSRLENFVYAKSIERTRVPDPAAYKEQFLKTLDNVNIMRRFISDIEFPDATSYRIGVVIIAFAPRSSIGRDLLTLSGCIKRGNTSFFRENECIAWYSDRKGPLAKYVNEQW